MLFSRRAPSSLPTADQTLPGRSDVMPVAAAHAVHGRSIDGPFVAHLAEIQLGLGCFWGAERLFWGLDGVHTTAVGYGGGHTPNPTYREVCSGRTAHTELVRIIYDPAVIALDVLLKVFWEAHDPTQGMRQGNDVGTQYRSAIFWTDAKQQALVEASSDRFAAGLKAASAGQITTQMAAAGPFYYAEDHHQQYLHKNPGGYCGLAGTGVTCPLPG
jgi:peptide-methionine (S)-S-oxide reductase